LLLIILPVLETLITSKTRVRLLVKFFINVANNGHLRGLADEFNESTNAIRKELNSLSEAGYLTKVSQQNKINYRANTQHPLFATLQHLVFHYIGLPTLVELVLERMGPVQQVYVTGDYAKGIDSGTIVVVLVGNALREDYIEQLAGKLSKEIARQVHFTVATSYSGDGLLVYDGTTAEANSVILAD
jgi:hypothetical protein